MTTATIAATTTPQRTPQRTPQQQERRVQALLRVYDFLLKQPTPTTKRA